MVNSRPAPSRILGIDYGMARLGLAISDERKLIATPLATFVAEKKLSKQSKNLCNGVSI